MSYQSNQLQYQQYTPNNHPTQNQYVANHKVNNVPLESNLNRHSSQNMRNSTRI
jgi:hypothetical protein